MDKSLKKIVKVCEVLVSYPMKAMLPLPLMNTFFKKKKVTFSVYSSLNFSGCFINFKLKYFLLLLARYFLILDPCPPITTHIPNFKNILVSKLFFVKMLI